MSRQVDDFQFHFGEQTASDMMDLDEHSSSSAIAFLSLPPVHPPSPTNIFLANFPKSWSEYDLAQIFDGIPILTVHVIRDKICAKSGGGVSRGVGFVKKVEVDVNGMMDPTNRGKDCERIPGRRQGPKVNLLKELDLVISLTKKPFQRSHSSNQSSPVTPDGLCNLWVTYPYTPKYELNGWPNYARVDPMSSPNERNPFSLPTTGYGNPWSTKDNLEPYPNHWDLWQSKQTILPEPATPRILGYSHQMRSDSHSEVFRKPTSPSSTDSVTDEYSRSCRGQSPGFDYGFIGGPAVDISSGTVISPRRYQPDSSLTSSEEAKPRYL